MPAEIRDGVLLRAWCRIPFSVFLKGGVKDVVLCPGSRNAPLIWAALEHQGLRCHSVIDERSAAFFGVGLSRASGVPTVICCTSGSALGHFLPAAMEASGSDVPLILLTADRPLRLQNVGAPQTLDQVGVFSSFAQSVGTWQEPSLALHDCTAWAQTAADALVLSLNEQRAVHLNVPLDKPLEPQLPESEQERRWEEQVAHVVHAVKPSSSEPDTAPLRELFQRFLSAPGPHAIGLGPTTPLIARLARALGEKLGIVVLSELPQCGESQNLDELADALALLERRFSLLHVGLPMVSSRWAELLKSGHVQYFCLPGARLRDPEKRAQALVCGNLQQQLGDLLKDAQPLMETAATCFTVAPLNPEATHSEVAEERTSSQDADEVALFEAILAQQMPTDVQLFLGNSLSVRLAAWGATGCAQHFSVYTCRGVNGIDGTIAQAAGVALSTQAPTLCILGDVTALHDVGSFAQLRRLTTAFVLLIVDNQGGRIFDHLPAGSLLRERPDVAEFFHTAPRVHWEQVCAAFGVPCTIVTSVAGAQACVSRAWQESGAQVIVVKTDPESTGRFLARMRARRGA